METISNDLPDLNIITPEKLEPKNYAQPDVLCRTFETLSNLHKLLPNHLVELLQSYQSEEDKKKCEISEFSGLERILAGHELPKEINLTPKPSAMHSWKRKAMNNFSVGWKKCHMWKRNMKEPPMCTVVVRWLKKNMQPTEDLKSVIYKLSVFGPIRSVTPCGRQSAIVVYQDITSACNAVNAFQSRIPGTMFHCSWQHRFMTKDENLGASCMRTSDPKLTNPKQKMSNSDDLLKQIKSETF